MDTIGIDFGTSNTTVALLRDGETKPFVVVYPENQGGKIPSLLLKMTNGWSAGFEAEMNMQSIHFASKDDIISIQSRFVQGLKRYLNPKAVEYFDDQEYTHLDLLTEYLKYVLDKCEEHQGKIKSDTKIVFSYPIGFLDANVKLIRSSFERLGFSDIECLKEPIAAAKGYELENAIAEGEGILVFDYGGGTTDVCYVQKKGEDLLTPIEPNGNLHCGGLDVDKALFDHFCKQLSREYNVDVSDGISSILLSRSCRILKEKFSNHADSNRVPCLILADGKSINYTLQLTRNAFNTIIYNKVCEAVRTAEKVINKTRQNNYSIDKILLIGGSSRIELVREQLEKLIPNAQICSCGTQDVAVALGNAAKNLLLDYPDDEEYDYENDIERNDEQIMEENIPEPVQKKVNVIYV